LFDDDDGGYGAVSRALHALEAVSEWEPGAAAWIAELREIEIRLGELEPDLSRRLEEVEADPRRLDAVEERLATLERLFKKYGESTEAVLETRAGAAAELQELEDAASGGEELEAEFQRAVDDYRSAATELTAARGRWGRTLAEGVIGHVKELALEKARFAARLEHRPVTSSAVEIDGVPVEAGPLGVDHVVYDFSPNPGEELRPLAKVASGGELSRLYLAVQLASRDLDRAGGGAQDATLVFDEVDAGISGAEAAVLGGKLRKLARGGQILAVTHLPQVASQADGHYRVRKDVSDGRTRTRVERLTAEGRVQEVARMLAGSEVTDLSLDHARELIAGAA
ncbi:MAG: DNA repair protein RecN, partial [Acidobacteriota bacterium]